MKRAFDGFLYIANWGTHELMLRLPKAHLPLKRAKPYGRAGALTVRAGGHHVILAFSSTDEARDFIAEPDGLLTSLLPLRAELAAGDLRALYLGWLLGVQMGELCDDEREPPCPPGLARLTPAQETLLELLRIDRSLVTAAARRSAELPSRPSRAVQRRRIAAMPSGAKTELLLQILEGSRVEVRAELLRAVQPAVRERSRAEPARRTVRELLAEAEDERDRRPSRRRAPLASP